MSVWKDLCTVGTPIEYEYKGKVWKNGVVITCNKYHNSIKIKIRKRIDKYKTIQLSEELALTLYNTNALKISNIKYPSWVALDAIFEVTKSVNTFNTNQFSVEYKICWFRDSKYITLYPTMEYLQYTTNNDLDVTCLTIKDEDITHMQSGTIITNKFILKRRKYSIDIIYKTIHNFCNIPLKIFAILMQYLPNSPTIKANEWQKNGYRIHKHRMDPIARVLLMGVYDDDNCLSIFRGMRYLVRKIWLLVLSFNDMCWKPFIEDTGTYYKRVGVIYSGFPAPTNININMMPFIMSKHFTDSKLPSYAKPYWHMINRCLGFNTTEINKIGFLTINESVVDQDRTQRRPGLHVETPGKVCIKGGGSHEEYINSYYWGVGRIDTDQDGYKHDKNIRRIGGIYMASSVRDSCAVWDCKIVKYGDKEAIGHLGDMEHLRHNLPSDRKCVMEEDCIYWLTDRTPHESLPMQKTECRQFFRLVAHKVSIWYEQHSTKNPNGVVPDKHITRIIKGSKFCE